MSPDAVGLSDARPHLPTAESALGRSAAHSFPDGLDCVRCHLCCLLLARFLAMRRGSLVLDFPAVDLSPTRQPPSHLFRICNSGRQPARFRHVNTTFP